MAERKPFGGLSYRVAMRRQSFRRLQQFKAMGRGTAEWIVHSSYRTLDLSVFHCERIAAGRGIVEGAII